MATISYKAVGGLASNQYQLYCMEVAFTTSDNYTTGGIPIPFKGFVPTMVVGIEEVTGVHAYEPVFDLANKKLKLFVDDSTSGVPAEESAGALSTACTFHLTFFGLLG